MKVEIKFDIEKFREQNEKERLRFVDLWSKYVLENDDKVWSRQQNVIINASLKSAISP